MDIKERLKEAMRKKDFAGLSPEGVCQLLNDALIRIVDQDKESEVHEIEYDRVYRQLNVLYVQLDDSIDRLRKLRQAARDA